MAKTEIILATEMGSITTHLHMSGRCSRGMTEKKLDLKTVTKANARSQFELPFSLFSLLPAAVKKES